MEEKYMKLRTAVFLIALTAAACTPAPDKTRASELEQSPPAAIQAKQESPDGAVSKAAPQGTPDKQLLANFLEIDILDHLS